MADKGKVKWFSNVKGYGFLEKEGSPDIFVHYSSIQGEGYKRLKSGEEVAFDLVEGKKGPQASNVVRTKAPKKEAAAAEAPKEAKKK